MSLTEETQSNLIELRTQISLLPLEDLRTIFEEIKDIIKQLEDPKYGIVKELESRKVEIDSEFEALIAALPPEQAEKFRALQTQRISVDRHFVRARVDLVKPKVAVAVKYLIDDKVVEWTGKGAGPKEIQAVLTKEGWNKDEKDAKKKAKQKEEILAKYRVKE